MARADVALQLQQQQLQDSTLRTLSAAGGIGTPATRLQQQLQLRRPDARRRLAAERPFRCTRRFYNPTTPPGKINTAHSAPPVHEPAAYTATDYRPSAAAVIWHQLANARRCTGRCASTTKLSASWHGLCPAAAEPLSERARR